MHQGNAALFLLDGFKSFCSAPVRLLGQISTDCGAYKHQEGADFCSGECQSQSRVPEWWLWADLSVSDMGERALPLQSMPIITLPHLLCAHYVLFTSLKPSESILKWLHSWNVCNYLLCETTYCGSFVRDWELRMRQLRDLKNNCLGWREVRSTDPKQAQPHVPFQYHMTHQPPPNVAPSLEAREFWAVLEGNPILMAKNILIESSWIVLIQFQWYNVPTLIHSPIPISHHQCP